MTHEEYVKLREQSMYEDVEYWARRCTEARHTPLEDFCLECLYQARQNEDSELKLLHGTASE